MLGTESLLVQYNSFSISNLLAFALLFVQYHLEYQTLW